MRRRLVWIQGSGATYEISMAMSGQITFNQTSVRDTRGRGIIQLSNTPSALSQVTTPDIVVSPDVIIYTASAIRLDANFSANQTPVQPRNSFIFLSYQFNAPASISFNVDLSLDYIGPMMGGGDKMSVRFNVRKLNSVDDLGYFFEVEMDGRYNLPGDTVTLSEEVTFS